MIEVRLVYFQPKNYFSDCLRNYQFSSGNRDDHFGLAFLIKNSCNHEWFLIETFFHDKN
jgi:hypothetical protein